MDDEISFALPPFKPDEALAGLKRSLRALGLAERGGAWERRGQAVAQAAVDGDAIAAAVVKRPLRNSPEWQRKTLRDSAAVRDFVADLQRRLASWSDTDD